MRDIFVIIYYLLFLLSILSCSNDKPACKDINNDSDKIYKRDMSSSFDTLPEYEFEYTPLTLQKLQAIRNNSESFNAIEIVYSRRTNPGSNGPQDILKLYLEAGDYFEVFNNSMVSEYEGALVHIDQTIPLTSDFHQNFSKTEINAIFDHIESYSDYFFNHDEFNGENQVLSDDYGLCHDVYKFSISIVKPEFLLETWQEQYFPAWCISKCIDEYPNPDHPLYGLFEMLENDFISQFE